MNFTDLASRIAQLLTHSADPGPWRITRHVTRLSNFGKFRAGVYRGTAMTLEGVSITGDHEQSTRDVVAAIALRDRLLTISEAAAVVAAQALPGEKEGLRSVPAPAIDKMEAELLRLAKDLDDLTVKQPARRKLPA